MKTYRRSLTSRIIGLLVLLPIAIPIGLYRRSAAQEERNAELMQALSTGQVAEARALLAQGADPNTRDLPTAPARGLLQHIVDLFTPPPPPAIIQERTALSCACTNRNAAALVKLLLEKGADAKAVETGRTPGLYWAARRGDIATVQLLLERGSNVNVTGPGGAGGLTPLRGAIRADSPHLVKLLVDHGAVVDTWAVGEEYPPIGHNYAAILEILADASIRKGTPPSGLRRLQ